MKKVAWFRKYPYNYIYKEDINHGRIKRKNR